MNAPYESEAPNCFSRIPGGNNAHGGADGGRDNIEGDNYKSDSVSPRNRSRENLRLNFSARICSLKGYRKSWYNGKIIEMEVLFRKLSRILSNSSHYFPR